MASSNGQTFHFHDYTIFFQPVLVSPRKLFPVLNQPKQTSPSQEPPFPPISNISFSPISNPPVPPISNPSFPPIRITSVPPVSNPPIVDLPDLEFCPLCPEAFGEDSSLKLHLQTCHASFRKIQCDFCFSKFETLKDMHVHVGNIHGPSNILSKKLVKCQLCPTRCGNSHGLSVHMGIKHKSLHECPWCPYQSRSMRNYYQHLKIHK